LLKERIGLGMCKCPEVGMNWALERIGEECGWREPERAGFGKSLSCEQRALVGQYEICGPTNLDFILNVASLTVMCF
jgi:hypothetical protein